MKLIEEAKKSLYEVDIEFMIGDADGEEHYVVPLSSLPEVIELTNEIDRYHREKSWNQQVQPKVLEVFAEYPILMKHLCYMGDDNEYTLEQIKQGYGEIYWPRDYNWDYYLHLMYYKIFKNENGTRYQVILDKEDKDV